jgi:heat shock protein HtpX
MNQKKLGKYNSLNIIQSLLLVISMGLVLGLTGWLIGGFNLAAFAVGLTFFLFFSNLFFSPYIVARMYRGRPLSYSEAPGLYQLLKKISCRAGLRNIPWLFYIPGDGINAFTSGTGENAVVAISEGLLRRLSLRETAAVLAHEISHIRNDDIRIMSFAGMTSQLTYWLSSVGQFFLIFNLPMILVNGQTISWTAIFLLIMAPSINGLLQLALSRTREYRADLGAAELLGNPEPMASALSKIDRYQNGYLRWLFWPKYQRVPEAGLLRTHPPTEKRIQKLFEIRYRPKVTNETESRFSYQASTFERRVPPWNPLIYLWNALRMTF